ncbi:hypothetical protein GCK72_003312 [Caenorhabditis remanei]|uniref:Uncharacterized protein n=1 Tax=Caenorhabditis remanei TaxID=31234 RepID=A0A6A5HV24_CAERE|nr:hypothetical protein GCK72_003312 [Caenorhabditis remanei]KAF1771485.1 hypothetical protein GCK72_003312 [Caenorhabditis remanei]
MHRPFRCPILVTAAVVGGAALAAIIYYYWSRPKKCSASDCCGATDAPGAPGAGATPSVSLPAPGEPKAVVESQRAGAGKETGLMFNIEDEQVRKVCEKLFTEQMDLGEAYMDDEETSELGAIHMSNAIALTGETAQLLKVLRGSISPASLARIQKYLPTADLRVQQMLQDELAIETIEQHFA